MGHAFNLRQSHRLIVIWISTLSIISSISLVIYVGSGVFMPDVWAFHIPWHVLNYQDFGFVKRGLLGTLISFFRPAGDLQLLCLLVFLAFSVVFTGSVSWYLVSRRVPSLVCLAIILSPCTFLHFGFDSPRSSELLWLTIFILSLMVSESIKKPLLCSLTCSFLCCLSILVYEGSVFITVPAIVLRLYFSSRNRPYDFTSLMVLVFVLPIGVVLLLLQLYGGFEGGYDLLSIKLLSIAPNSNPEILSEVLIADLISQNTSLAYGTKFTWFCNSVLLIGYLLMFLSPLVYAIYRYFGKLWCISYCVASSAGMALFLVALDYARYCSLILLVSVLLAISLLGEKYLKTLPRAWILTCCLAFMLGPVGVSPANPFPVLKYIFKGNLYPLF